MNKTPSPSSFLLYLTITLTAIAPPFVLLILQDLYPGSRYEALLRTLLVPVAALGALTIGIFLSFGTLFLLRSEEHRTDHSNARTGDLRTRKNFTSGGHQ